MSGLNSRVNTCCVAAPLDLEAYFEQHNPHARQHLLETLLDAIERGAWQADEADRVQLEQALAQSVDRHGSDCALPSCRRAEVVKTEQSAPAAAAAPVASSGAAAALAEPSPAANVEGYVLEPRTATPVQPVQQKIWLWLLVTAALVAAGSARRPCW